MCAPDNPAAETPHRTPAKRRVRSGVGLVLAGAVAGVVAGVAVHVAYMFLGGNFHAIVPGRIYRSAQPSPEHLERLIHAYKIRTVINLRGQCSDDAWYMAECQAARRLDLRMEDVGLWASQPPPAGELRHLIDVLDRGEYPMLLHCGSGGDRSGFAAVIALLLVEGVSTDKARGELALRFGHYAYGKAACLERFFDCYESWLRERGFEHSPDHFRRWALKEYCPANAVSLSGTIGIVPHIGSAESNTH